MSSNIEAAVSGTGSEAVSEAVSAVVFDFGGVLTLPPLDHHVENLCTLCGLERQVFEREYRHQRTDYDRGVIDSREYWSRVVNSTGKILQAETYQALFEGDAAAWTRINQSVLDWAKRLQRAGVRIGILSNMPRDILHWIEERFAWINDFEVRVFSCDLGMNKPSADIYKSCLQALKLEGGQVLFIDDVPENIAGAERAGIKAVLFRGLGHTLTTIAEHGWLPTDLVAELYR
jgi:putative hydrolase of the HAD superfamily